MELKRIVWTYFWIHKKKSTWVCCLLLNWYNRKVERWKTGKVKTLFLLSHIFCMKLFWRKVFGQWWWFLGKDAPCEMATEWAEDNGEKKYFVLSLGNWLWLGSFHSVMLPPNSSSRKIRKIRMQAGEVRLPKIPQEHHESKSKPFQTRPNNRQSALRPDMRLNHVLSLFMDYVDKNMVIHNWITIVNHIQCVLGGLPASMWIKGFWFNQETGGFQACAADLREELQLQYPPSQPKRSS